MHELNDIMGFDQVIEVREDGSIIERTEIFAPDVYNNGGDIYFAGAQGWTALNGYSGQEGYSGPIMHESEYIGGLMADHIASTPGIYVAVIVGDHDEHPSGWAVLRQDDPEICDGVGKTAKYPDRFTNTGVCPVCGAVKAITITNNTMLYHTVKVI